MNEGHAKQKARIIRFETMPTNCIYGALGLYLFAIHFTRITLSSHFTSRRVCACVCCVWSISSVNICKWAWLAIIISKKISNFVGHAFTYGPKTSDNGSVQHTITVNHHGWVNRYRLIERHCIQFERPTLVSCAYWKWCQITSKTAT